jgi:hypothetical protein
MPERKGLFREVLTYAVKVYLAYSKQLRQTDTN